jgi:hypothetical protein
MAQSSTINLQKLSKDLFAVAKKLDRIEDIATTRALNASLAKEQREISGEVAQEYGITKSAVKQKTKATKATKSSKRIALTFRSTRMNLNKPKQLKKGGISFQAIGRRRVKVTVGINGGSKGFTIKAKAGGQTGGDDIKLSSGQLKKVPVYRAFGSKKLTTLKGSSIAHMVERLEIDDKRLLERIIRDFPDEYNNQLKRAKYTGSR